MLKWIKENKIILITMLIFETVAISLFISTKNLFYLLNFNYIGICISIGMYLMSHKVKYARNFVQLAVGLYMLVYLGRLNKPDIVIEDILESLFNFWEFIADEYSGNIMSDCRELGISIKEFDTMDKAYREKGIICAQEKDLILEMIQEITKHLS